MKCEDCKELVSSFLDCELSEDRSAMVRAHIAVCETCGAVYEDCASILDVCHEESADDLVPPNSRALWCRINNVIESESGTDRSLDASPQTRLWQLTLPQLASAILAIGLISSLLTVVVISNNSNPAANDIAAGSVRTPTTFEKILSKVGLADNPKEARDHRLQQQRATIEYWNERVQTRRVQWDTGIRNAFDRNLNEINQAVNDYTLILENNPEDELSGEMLDSALHEKMNLLREFSEL
ncbi:MAG: zf-HC2 domain-containing protein [Pyrinomonadaceae bacterium]